MAGKQPKRGPRPGVDAYGRSPLHDAAGCGDAAKVKELLASGADPNAQDDNGWSPLHFAAQVVSAPVTELLLSAGAKVTAKDSFGNTALWRAVMSSRGDGSVITLLLDAGADPNEPNNSGTSPLQVAHSIGNFDVKQFFKDLPLQAEPTVQPDGPASGESAG